MCISVINASEADLNFFEGLIHIDPCVYSRNKLVYPKMESFYIRSESLLCVDKCSATYSERAIPAHGRSKIYIMHDYDASL